MQIVDPNKSPLLTNKILGKEYSIFFSIYKRVSFTGCVIGNYKRHNLLWYKQFSTVAYKATDTVPADQVSRLETAPPFFSQLVFPSRKVSRVCRWVGTRLREDTGKKRVAWIYPAAIGP